MSNKELRKTIGDRMRKRRNELNLTQDYLAEKLDVNKSTIQRYESGKIDNTKKLVVLSLAKALHVSPEWLTGETDEMSTDASSKLNVEILDAVESVKDSFPVGVDEVGNEFSQSLLLLLLKEYRDFNDSFASAYKTWHGEKGYGDIAEKIGFDSADEFNEVMFLREIMHTSDTFLELSNLLKDYPKDHEGTLKRLKHLLSFYK